MRSRFIKVKDREHTEDLQNVRAHGDRFGITWHPSIAGGVLAHLDRLDLIEVIPEGRLFESRSARRALRRLARTLPVAIHGVSLGLASMTKPEPRRLDRFARLLGEIEPESWSEHLAFVRGCGIELGHLAAPPRTAVSVEATAAHLELARRIAGSYPCVENVATPIDPPGSDRSEQAWLLDLLNASPVDLLLDLHNLYSNGRNFGFDAKALLRALPAGRIRTIHIAGGADVRTHGGDIRRVDDHLHDVPDPVYELLEIVGQVVPHAVDVVLERDGAFPAFDRLLGQVDRAREALARGRSRAATTGRCLVEEPDIDISHAALPQSCFAAPPGSIAQGDREHQARLESFLVRLYTDDALRTRFLAAPLAEAALAGLSLDMAQQMAGVDRAGLQLAAATFTRKRQFASSRGRPIDRLRALLWRPN